MFAPVILIVATQLSASFLNADDQISPQVAAERVALCGVGTVTVRSDAQLDTDVLVVAARAPVTDQQVGCMVKAASFYDVELPPTVQPRFNAIREARSAALMASEARTWLMAHHLDDRLPKYREGVTDDAAFVRKIEKLCGADHALQSSYGPHALSPEWMKRHETDEHLENGPLACLMRVTWATGFKIGFIGNERAAQ